MSLTFRFIAVLALVSSALNGNVARAQVERPNGGYLFPTDASHRINSGFADYRETHFHGGIDISTNGKIGYPVYAAKSGYVYRVTTSPYGYGKRIVLRHYDSSFTLYAHLSAFSEEIEERVEAAQDSTGRYDVDLRFRPGEIGVERGEVIARTGATGVGGPHLHFEVRDKDYGLVDPLTYKSLDITDRRAPRVFGVGVRGFYSGRARLSGVVRMRHGYRAAEVFRMHEPFFFIIHAADSYTRGHYKRPPKHMELLVDGRKYLSVNLTHIELSNYLDVSSLVDLDLSRDHSYKTYYKLCVDRASPFPVFTPSAPLSGLVYENVSNGTHTYEIKVADENGNSTSIKGKFVLDIGKGKQSAGKPIVVKPFKEEVFSPLPGLTLRFPADAFVKSVNVKVSRVSSRAFTIRADGASLVKRIPATWKVNDRRFGLFRKDRSGWTPVSYTNDGRILKARIGYELGEFALIKDEKPPVVERIRVSKRNPLYRSVAPPDLRRDFVYFRVFDNLSNINTDDILLKVGEEKFICEYDSDKHTVLCRVDADMLRRVDADMLRRVRKVEVIVRDNAGNESKVTSRLRIP